MSRSTFFSFITLLFLATASMGRENVYINVAFASDRTGIPQIYLMGENDLNAVQLTDNPYGCDTPVISPDGERIAFANNVNNIGFQVIAVMNIDGSQVLEVLPGGRGQVQIAWSPDGEQLAFSIESAGIQYIYRANADGSDIVRLTNNPDLLTFWPNWSPDGTQIMYIAQQFQHPGQPLISDIFLMSADGDQVFEPVNLTNDQDARVERSVAWSKDGTQVVFGVYDGQYDLWHAYFKLDEAELSTYQNLTDTPELDEYAPHWNWDTGGSGGRIAFSRSAQNEPPNIWGCKVAVPRFFPMTGSQFADFTPSWGPPFISSDYPNPVIQALTPAPPSWVDDPFIFARTGGNQETNIFLVDPANGGDPVQLTNNPWGAGAAVLSPDGTRIAFINNYYGYQDAGDGQITVMNSDGSSMGTLTSAGNGGHMHWSPDGTRLAFARETDGLSQIFTINADGTHLQELAQEPGRSSIYPSWGPAGEYIMFVSGNGPQLDNPDVFVATPDGARWANFTNDGNQRAEKAAAWSPDGEGALVVVDQGTTDIWHYYLDGSPPQNLTNTPGVDEYNAAWSKDSQSMAYTRNINGQFPDIWASRIDGSDPQPVFYGPEYDYFQPSWGTAGNGTPNPLIEALFPPPEPDPLPPWVYDNLVFVSSRSGESNIQIFRIAAESGDDIVQLTDNPLGVAAPSLSPEGDRIAFVNDLYGNSQIAVMNSDGSGIVNLTDGGRGGLISWSPHGEQLAFFDEDGIDGVNQIFTIGADGSNRQQLTHDPVRSSTNPIWGPDGRHILYVSGEGEAPGFDQPDVFIMGADGSHPVNITADGNHQRELAAAWSPDGSNVLIVVDDGQYDIWLYHLDGSLPQNLTDTPDIDEFHPAWSKDGRSMAYTRIESDQRSNLWFSHIDGSLSDTLTYDLESADFRANWGAAGNGIPNPLIEALFPPPEPDPLPPWVYDNFVFASNRARGDSQIFRIARESGDQVIQVTDHPGGAAGPVLSPGGDQIAFSYDIHGDTEFAVMNVDGSDVLNLHPAGRGGKLHWSPDGTRLAFFCQVEGVDQIFSIHADGTNLHQLTRDPGRSASHPSWNPEGEFIMYVSKEVPNGDNPDVFIMTADGLHSLAITHDGGATRELSAVWSPDGQSALVVVEDGQYDIWRYYLNGTPPQNLTNTPDAYEHSPAWSPDGQSMAYTHHFVSQRSNILFMHIDGTPLPLLIHDTESSDFHPSWAGGGSVAAAKIAVPKRAANIEDTSWGQIKQRFAPSTTPNTRE